MIELETIEKISKKYSESTGDFILHGSTLTLKEKKRNYQIEKLEILSRYEAATVGELENKIKEGQIPEHPGWEYLIEIKNIEKEIEEIESDIGFLQKSSENCQK